MRYTVGIDVGGTFTDFVAHDLQSNEVRAWKQLTVPGDPVTGILSGLAGKIDAADISNLRIGTTVATNAVLERKGVSVAYITTAGFRDVPFIQRGNRRFHYDMSWVKPKPLVKRRHCYEVDERIAASGAIVRKLDEAAVVELARKLANDDSVEAVAVCLMFSYLNPDHEYRIRDIFLREAPRLPVSLSYDVVPKWKEYERASTTIADAYLKPIVASQMLAMRERLEKGGQTAHKAVIKSNGGEALPEAAAQNPIHLLVSGPSGGVIASRFLAEITNSDKLVTLDMGGTSTDVSTVIAKKERFTTSFEIEWGIPIQIPMIDIRTIGAGGGSLAWIDKGGMLRVGPHSAGSSPGPACYGKGATGATVTDANVVLGRISPDNFLGGNMKLDSAAAIRAIQALADQLNMSVHETALSIVRIATTSMIGALNSVFIEEGYDHREFILNAFGGAGPPHAAELIAEMGIPRAIIPHNPGQFSAYGFLHASARVDRQRTMQMTTTNFDAKRARELMQALVDECTAELSSQGYVKGLVTDCKLEMRYLGQNYELELPVAADFFQQETPDTLWKAFHVAHQDRFGFSTPGETIEIVTFSATVSAITQHPALPKIARSNDKPAPRSSRKVGFVEGILETPIYWRDDLLAGQAIEGPAVVEEAASITLLIPGQTMTVDPYGHLIITGN